MSIKLQLKKRQIEIEEKIEVNFIPASVNKNGAIKIDEFFNKYTVEENGGGLWESESLHFFYFWYHSINFSVYTNSIRGYSLKGQHLKLPENLNGVIFRESESLQSGDRTLKFGGNFTKFIYWNYNRLPSENDSLKKSFHYLDIVDAVSSLYTKDDLNIKINIYFLATFWSPILSF